MKIKRTGHYAAVAAALVAAALQASSGMASASTGAVRVWTSGGPDELSCKATALQCTLTAYVLDSSAPVTISVNGTVIMTGQPAPDPYAAPAGKLTVTWTPQKVGVNTITAQQGAESDSIAIQIMDNNGLDAFLERNHIACKTGSGGCPPIGHQ